MHWPYPHLPGLSQISRVSVRSCAALDPRETPLLGTRNRKNSGIITLLRHFLRNLILRKLLLILLKCSKQSKTSFQVSFLFRTNLRSGGGIKITVICSLQATSTQTHVELNEEKTAPTKSYHLLVVALRPESAANLSSLRALALRRPCDVFLVWARILDKMPGRWSRWDSTTRGDFNSNSLDWCS